jgi:hypothetical protein
MLSKMIKLLGLNIALFVLFANSLAYSQNVTVNASIDTNNVLIGDQIKLRLILQSDKKTNIVMPLLPDSIGKIEIVSRGKIDTLDSAGRYSLRQTFMITSFDSGVHVFPVQTFMFEKQGIAELYPLSTDSIMLHFKTFNVDTTQAIKDIKGPLDTPMSWDELLPYIITAWIIIAFIVIAWYLWTRYKKKAKMVELDYDPKIPAHIIALEALKQLDSEKLWQKGYTKDYYVRMTEILWKYIERRFDIPAIDMLSREIIDALKLQYLNNELVQRLAKIFDIADLVKFAKYEPLPDENGLTIGFSFDFINMTISSEPLKKSEEDKN